MGFLKTDLRIVVWFIFRRRAHGPLPAVPVAQS
jgi:hypothetical protein